MTYVEMSPPDYDLYKKLSIVERPFVPILRKLNPENYQTFREQVIREYNLSEHEFDTLGLAAGLTRSNDFLQFQFIKTINPNMRESEYDPIDLQIGQFSSKIDHPVISLDDFRHIRSVDQRCENSLDLIVQNNHILTLIRTHAVTKYQRIWSEAIKAMRAGDADAVLESIKEDKIIFRGELPCERGDLAYRNEPQSSD